MRPALDARWRHAPLRRVSGEEGGELRKLGVQPPPVLARAAQHEAGAARRLPRRASRVALVSGQAQTTGRRE
jgi:hypothetical protein